MKIYVASSWREELQPHVVAALRAYGHEVYDFRNPGDGNKGFSWSDIDPAWEAWDSDEFVKGLDHPLAAEHYKLDYDAMQWCDACVLVVPGTAGRSSHLELGWCAGAGKLTVVLLTGEEPELMYKLATHVVTSLDAVRRILGWAEVTGVGPFERNRSALWRDFLDDQGRPTHGPARGSVGCHKCGGDLDALAPVGKYECPWCIAMFTPGTQDVYGAAFVQPEVPK